MNRNGMSTVELLVTLAAFTAVAGGIMLAGRAGMNASTTTDSLVQQSSRGRTAIATLTNEFASTNIKAVATKRCNSGECIGDKIIFKVPIIDSTPVAGSMYTPDGKIKFGAGDFLDLDSNGVPKQKQNCRYQYMVNTQNQLVKKSICEPVSSGFCGNHQCTDPETTATCPVDCAYCGDNTCTAQNGENPNNCIDCVTCGDGLCSPGENCSESKQCESDCGSCSGISIGSLAYCGDGQCSGGESCSFCPVDCGACPPPGDDGQDPNTSGNYCGNGHCDTGEDLANCCLDCCPAAT